MKRTFIKDLKVCEEEKVLLRGWVHKIRDLASVTFVMLRDKSGIIQLVCTKEQIKGLRLENSIEVTGMVRENEKALGGIEIEAEKIDMVGKVYYDKLPFEIQGYKTKEMFTVDYFGRRAFLAQSPQFYKQMMVGAGFERVFEVGYAYRAELHNTYRHLNEYISLDVEIGFIKDEKDLMDIEENFLRYMFKHLKETCKEELKLYDTELPDELNIPRIPLSEAQEILLAEYGKKSPVGNIDNEGELLFAQYVKEKYNCDFVFLTE